jgi:hypothetical protein
MICLERKETQKVHQRINPLKHKNRVSEKSIDCAEARFSFILLYLSAFSPKMQ